MTPLNCPTLKTPWLVQVYRMHLI